MLLSECLIDGNGGRNNDGEAHSSQSLDDIDLVNSNKNRIEKSNPKSVERANGQTNFHHSNSN